MALLLLLLPLSDGSGRHCPISNHCAVVASINILLLLLYLHQSLSISSSLYPWAIPWMDQLANYTTRHPILQRVVYDVVEEQVHRGHRTCPCILDFGLELTKPWILIMHQSCAYRDKEEILRKARLLKGSHIHISEDFSRKVSCS